MSQGFIFAFATLACWTLGTRSFANSTLYFPPALINKFRLLLAVLSLLLFLLAYSRITIHEIFFKPTIGQWTWFGMSGLVGLAIGDWFAFYAFKSIGASRTSLMGIVSPLAALVGGVLLLGEHVNLSGIMGVVLTLIAVSAIVYYRNKVSALDAVEVKSDFSGIVAAILAAVSQGVGVVITKYGLTMNDGPTLDFVHVTFIRMLAGFSVLFIIDILLWRDIDFISPFMKNSKGLIYVLFGTLFGPVLGVTASVASINYIGAGVSQTIFSMLPISVMLSGVMMGREKVAGRVWLYTLIAIAGVIILIWRDEIAVLIGL